MFYSLFLVTVYYLVIGYIESFGYCLCFILMYLCICIELGLLGSLVVYQVIIIV